MASRQDTWEGQETEWFTNTRFCLLSRLVSGASFARTCPESVKKGRQLQEKIDGTLRDFRSGMSLEPCHSSTATGKWHWFEVTYQPHSWYGQARQRTTWGKCSSSLWAEGQSRSAHWTGWFISTGYEPQGASCGNITRLKLQSGENRFLRNTTFLVKKGWFPTHKWGSHISWHETAPYKSGSALCCVVLLESWQEPKQWLSQQTQVFQSCPVPCGSAQLAGLYVKRSTVKDHRLS